MCGPVPDGMHVLSRADSCREVMSSDQMCTPLERQLPAVFVTLTHGETGQNPTESDIVHLVHPREYGYGTDGRVSDGQRSDGRCGPAVAGRACRAWSGRWETGLTVHAVGGRTSWGGWCLSHQIWRMQIQLMPYERGTYSRNTTCGSRTTDPSVAAGRESDARTEWCRSAEPGGWEDGGRSHAGGAVMADRGVAVRREPDGWAWWGRPAGPGGRGDADRMPCGRVWRVSTGRGAIGRSESGGQGVGMGL